MDTGTLLFSSCSMAVPSFARTTTSSTLKASSRSAKSKDTTKPETTHSTDLLNRSPAITRKLKRPSTLTRRDRESIAYSADLHYIKPSNPSKPCPLAALPSELRTIIYSYVSGNFQRPVLMNYRRERHYPPALLQICRAVRIEAAYMYYTYTAFTWIVKNLNFTTVTKWLSSLPSAHRALLSRNKKLTIEIIPGLQKSYTYPPKDFLLDATVQDHWKACQPFGNLYSVKGLRTSHGTHDHVRVNFILFCRLASWLKLCSQPSYADVDWDYTFYMPQDTYSKRELNKSLGEHERSFCLFLRFELKKLWTRNRCEDRIKQPFLKMADAFIEAYEKMEAQSSSSIVYPCTGMVSRLQNVRELVEHW